MRMRNNITFKQATEEILQDPYHCRHPVTTNRKKTKSDKDKGKTKGKGKGKYKSKINTWQNNYRYQPYQQPATSHHTFPPAPPSTPSTYSYGPPPQPPTYPAAPAKGQHKGKKGKHSPNTKGGGKPPHK